MSPQKAGPERGIKTVHSIRRAVRIDPSYPVPLQGGRKIYEPSSPQTVSKVSQPTTIVGCWLAVLQKPATNCIMAEGVKGVQRGGPEAITIFVCICIGVGLRWFCFFFSVGFASL